MMVLFFTHIPVVVNHTINATLPERLQHYHSVYKRSAKGWKWKILAAVANSHDESLPHLLCLRLVFCGHS